jgi:hypothetical protein
VTGRVVEQEQAESKAICLALENVDRVIDLGDEMFRLEISIAVLAWFEHNTGLSVG